METTGNPGSILEEYDTTQDAFGNNLVRQTRNNADLASHYRYTPERHRFYRNGVRDVIQYDLAAGNSVSGFEDKRSGEEDVWVLSPVSGETLKFKSAERFRYTVNFVSEISQALALNQPLTNPDDRLIVGLDTSPNQDLSDGYFAEHLPTHDADEVDLLIKRNGNVVNSRKTVTLGQDITNYQRLENDYNWYNVGVSRWRSTVTKLKRGYRRQLNKVLETVGVLKSDGNSGPGGRGPISGNGHIVYEIEADSSTSGLELYAGSMSFTTLGDVAASVKAKGAETPALSVTQTTEWEPLGIAFRVDPGRPFVNVDFRGIELTQGSGELMIIGCDSSNVLDSNGDELTDSDFATTARPSGRPLSHNALNSVLQVSDTETVAQIPDDSGTPSTTAINPGGYQLAWDSVRASGQGSKTQQRSGDLEEKHGILDGDLAVPVIKADSTDDVRFSYPVEMDE